MAVEAKVNHQDVTLQEKVRFLERPETYAEGTGLVETCETHMSWVFLIDRFVYKLKKPVRYDFLDYSTLAARKHFCATCLHKRVSAGSNYFWRKIRAPKNSP